MTAFPDLARFAALYPETPGIVPHNLARHPLFTLEKLAELAERLPANDLEYNRGNLPLGIEIGDIPANGLSPGDTVRGIETNGSWMVMKFVEQDAAYRALLAETLAELDPVLARTTGPMLKQEAFIFVSSPNSVTPLHFDPEHNILLQLRGTKTMTIFPGDDEEIAPPDAHEAFYFGAMHRNLPWKDAYAPRGQRFALHPGDGIHVPLMAPHFVENGPDVSISFSVTWRSAASYRESEARGMNAILRKAGLHPRTPGRWPARNAAKSLGYRLARRMGITGR